MSDILQRSLGALPSLFLGTTGSFSSGSLTGDETGASTSVISFIRIMNTVQSKSIEDKLIEKELSLQKQRLSKPSLSCAGVRDSLLHILYCHLAGGHDVSFSYIHAMKLAQRGSNILDKRVGYLICSLFLNESNELVVLLINTLLKDLASTNILEVCTALIGAGHFLSPEMIPAVLPSVRDKLKHPKEIVRSKAVLCLASFLSKAPELDSQLSADVKLALSDSDPGVVWAAVEALHLLVKRDCGRWLELIPAIIDILTQVTTRRLPTHFDYRTVPAPWLTISGLRLLAVLATNRQESSELVYPLLRDIIHSTETSHKAGLAVIYEAIQTITQVFPNTELLSLAAKCVGRFLSAKNVGLKYLGLKMLTGIVRIDARYALEHQNVVIDCLDHVDPTIKASTRELVYEMANASNQQVICRTLVSHLNKTTDQFIRMDIINKVTDIVNRLSETATSYIEHMIGLLKICGPDTVAPTGTRDNLIAVLRFGITKRHQDSTLLNEQEMRKDKERQVFALKQFWTLLTSDAALFSMNETLLQAAVWTVGEYCQSIEDDVVSCDDAAKCLVNWYRHTSTTESSKLWILSALCKLIPTLTDPQTTVYSALVAAPVTHDHAKSFTYSSSLLPTYSAAASISCSLQIKQRLAELKTLCNLSKSCRQNCSTKSSITQVKMDFSLSFLDEFVSNALEAGALPYRETRFKEPPRQQPAFETKPLNFAAYTAPSVLGSSYSIRPGQSIRTSADIRSPSVHLSIPGSAGSQELTEFAGIQSPDEESRSIPKVWGVGGLIKQYASESIELEPKSDLNKNKSNVVQQSFKDVPAAEMENEVERRNLRSALFSGIVSCPSEINVITSTASIASTRPLQKFSTSLVPSVSSQITSPDAKKPSILPQQLNIDDMLSNSLEASDHCQEKTELNESSLVMTSARSISPDSIDSIDDDDHILVQLPELSNQYSPTGDFNVSKNKMGIFDSNSDFSLNTHQSDADYSDANYRDTSNVFNGSRRTSAVNCSFILNSERDDRCPRIEFDGLSKSVLVEGNVISHKSVRSSRLSNSCVGELSINDDQNGLGIPNASRE